MSSWLRVTGPEAAVSVLETVIAAEGWPLSHIELMSMQQS